MTMMTGIEASGVTKRFGARVAVDGLDLSIRAGEIYGFLGANGAGKSTTIRMLLGILKPDAGSISICERSVRRGDADGRRLVGAVGEVQHLYSRMTCLDYLTFFGRLYGLDDPRRRALETLDDVGLLDRRDDNADELSKGQQQKLGLARALLHNPPVLVLDEPVSGLDPHGIREVREIICRQRDRGRLVFFSSHVLSEVAQTADRIGIMLKGKLVFEGRVDAVLRRFSSLEEAFVFHTGGAMPLAEAAE